MSYILNNMANDKHSLKSHETANACNSNPKQVGKNSKLLKCFMSGLID